MARDITNIKTVAKKAKKNTVRKGIRGYVVTSSTSGKQYTVNLYPIASCNCEWAYYQPEGKPVACSHVQAVVAFVAAEEGYTTVARASTEDVRHLHRKVQRIGNGVKVTLRRAS